MTSKTSDTLQPILLPNTGERLLTEVFDQYTVEHLHRYALAVEFCRDRDVLDIASGEGYGSNLLAAISKSVIGVDIAKDAIAHATAKYCRKNLQFLHGAADSIPLGGANVDIVVSFETLEHHDKHEEMFSEIKRVLRPGGLLLMSTPEKLFYTDLPDVQNVFHVKELYLEEFRALVKRHFKNVGVLFQKTLFSSLIVPEYERDGFTYYRGTYDAIEPTPTMYQPFYNICLASDYELPQASYSVFDGSGAFDLYKKLASDRLRFEARVHSLVAELEHLHQSRSYRWGRILTWPLRKICDSNR